MTDPVALIKHLLSGGSLTDGIEVVSLCKKDLVDVNGLVSVRGAAVFDTNGNRVDITLTDLMDGCWDIYWPLDNRDAMRELSEYHYLESSDGKHYVLSNQLLCYDNLEERFLPCKVNPFTPGKRWRVSR